MGLRVLAAAAATLVLAACAAGIPKDTAFSAQAEDAIVVLPNATGHVLLTSVDPVTQRKDGVFEEYLDVSGKTFVVQRVPAGTYIFTSHSFYSDAIQTLKFNCLNDAAPVFEVKAGTVNFAHMVDPGRWNGLGLTFEKSEWSAKLDEALALYPNIDAPVEEASMVQIGIPVPKKGYGCMGDSYRTVASMQP
ncbi:MAG: hypothetical protein HRU11_12030 [Parvularculaceae bacterium]|nr:hypothetical protein [Parvularculaceae bacterium]